MEFMPDYSQKMQPDKDYLHIILSTLYPEQTYDMIDSAFKKRSVDNQTPKDHMIEMTPQILKMINQLVNVPSKCFLSAAALASHGRAIDLLKVKSKFWKERAKQKIYKVEIERIMNELPNLEQHQTYRAEQDNEESKEESKERENQDEDDMK